MRKYLDMENATLDICCNDINDYKTIIKDNIDHILMQNFKRVIFHIEEEKIENLYKVLKDYFIDKPILVMIYSSITDHINIDMIDNFLIVNTNNLNIINNSQIFNLIPINESSINTIVDGINNDINIMVEPIVDVNNISNFFNILNQLFDRLDGKNINLNGFIIPSFLMKEHPCNAYLCDGCHCKKEVSCLPKYITINNDFNLYPHDLFYDKLIIGNINNKKITDVLEEYYNTDRYKEFIKYSKKVFIKYLSHYPYEYMPIIEYIKMEIENDK